MAAELTIGQLSRRGGIAPTTLRYYEKIGLLPSPVRVGGQRRYEESALARLEVIAMCKVAGFTLDEITVLFADDVPGRPASRALAEAKLGEIDARIVALMTAKQVIEWGMACTCASIGACTCGVHVAKPAASAVGTSIPESHRRTLV